VLVSSLLSKLVDAGRPGRGDVEHAARLARRRAVRRAGLPARDPGPVGPLRAAARGRRGLPAPRPAGRAGPGVGRGGGAAGGPGRGGDARRVRGAAAAPGPAAPEPLRRARAGRAPGRGAARGAR
jgi:hypothetical protein